MLKNLIFSLLLFDLMPIFDQNFQVKPNRAKFNTDASKFVNQNITQSFFKFDASSSLINLLNIYVCTFLVIIGTIGNMISFIVFIRAGKKAPRIMTKNILILLTISNSIYLVLFWYISIFPKIIMHFKLDLSTNRNLNFTKTFNLTVESNSTIILAPKTTIGYLFIEKFYQINSNIFVCKILSYLISVSIFMNSSITVTFSVERALAINFPLTIRNLREKRRFLFKIIIILIISWNWIYPIYHLFLTDMIKYGKPLIQKKCDIPLQFESLYFKFTMMFVIQTLTVPFILITISNVSILTAIERNRKGLLQKRFEDKKFYFEKNGKPIKHINSLKSDFSIESFCLENKNHQMMSLRSPLRFRTSKNSKYKNSTNSSFKSSSCKTGGGNNKNMHITKMLIMISLSFVLFNLPYFVAWCRYAIFRVYNTKPFNQEQAKEIMNLYNVVKLTEILNLLNYAITGVLYFATGKAYRQNLYAFIRCGKIKNQNADSLYS